MTNIEAFRKFSTEEIYQELKRRNKVKFSAEFQKVFEVVARRFHVTPQEILGKCRDMEIQEARNVLYYLLHKRMGVGSQKTAELLRRKTHAVVLNGCHRVQKKIDKNRDYEIMLFNLIARCRM